MLATSKRYSGYAASGSAFYFVLEEQDDYELWRAEAGEALRVGRLQSPDFGIPRIAASTGDGGVIVSSGASREQFLLTRGSGFTQLSSLPESVRDEAIVPYRGGFLFTGFDVDGFRYLWRSAGSGAAVRVAELCRSCDRPRFEAFNDRMLLHFESSSLFGTDGTSVGTFLLADAARELVVGAGRAQFITGFGLSRTDGTLAGTRRIAGGLPLRVDVVNFGANPQHAPLPSGAVFAGRSGNTSGVWSVEDGSSARRVLEVPVPTQDFQFSSAIGADGRLFFQSPDDELWVVDSEGPRRLVQRHELGCSRSFTLAAIVGDRYLVNCFGFPGSLLAVSSDGAVEEISAAASDFGRRVVRVENRLLVLVDEKALLSDGTDGGTTTFFSGPPQSRLRFLASEGPLVYFSLIQSPGRDVYRSDLTRAGTRRVGSLPEFSNVLSSVVAGGALYVATDDFEIWRFDGSGGRRCDRLPPVSNPEYLASVAGRAAYVGVVNREDSVFSTDCDSSTRLGPHSRSTNAAPVVAGGRVFFYGADALEPDDAELWSSDGRSLGEPLGARLDLSEFFDGLVEVDGRAVFLAQEAQSGLELWVSDGTPQGTRLLHDLFPGPASSSPHTLTPSGSTLYFLADDGIVGRELFRLDFEEPGCVASSRALCLNRERFRVEATWRDFDDNSGAGRPARLTDDTGYFWFFDEDNVEVVLKVLDGSPINGNFWVFSGALSDVFYSLTVTDSETGRAKRYTNPRGNFGSFGDTTALGANARTGVLEIAASPRGVVSDARNASAACSPGPETVCVNQDRFQIEVDWSTTQGTSGRGNAVQLTEDTHSFWFFDPDNVELVVKVLDATAVNGRFWVFYGSLSDVEYTMRVTDTLTGQVRTYRNANGTFASVGDTSAF